ncbi:nicotinate phosphoribosyltransferase family protein [Histomonas meleagridis]|uniref:nicotinate phosphoribosyltransferase family protein n=1 Tax=Histomonas meleagridis TaxID=135588 RepID=UPI00355A039F|nr:nicotinate phosphoribosyltransferase family protein [Histomonas meleagridis]KAH0802588.1 nicotinate phosphoribosyltransferase family protein [Histomonas meleagridis]
MSAPHATAMLTDFYQITISRAFFNEGRQDEMATFDLFYRTQPFKGSFAIFAGLADAIHFIKNYKFTEEQLEYIKSQLPGDNDAFIDYLRNIDMKKVKISAIPEGSIVFPREPLIRVEGPIAYCQLIETPLLNCVNFATLMATNALRFKLHTHNQTLMEFGLRRAQGTDGAMSASKYSYLGLFDSTSNVLAGHLYGIPVSGTVAHSFVTSFSSIKDLKTTCIKHATTGELVDLYQYAQEAIKACNFHTNQSELASFISQAIMYPTNFLALVDTYNTLDSGVPNFLAVSYGLHKAGYKGKGIRLDSGDNVVLSKSTRQMFRDFSAKFDIPYAADFLITASNDINEKELLRLEELGNEINSFGIGTHLVTCQAQPALGGVYKLVEIDGIPRVKLSNSIEKSTLPCKKDLYRCYDENGKEVADLLTLSGEEPKAGDAFKVYPKTEECTLKCATFKPLYKVAWDGEAHVDTLQEARQRVLEQYNNFNKEVLTVKEAKEYPVLITPKYYKVMTDLINANKV